MFALSPEERSLHQFFAKNVKDIMMKNAQLNGKAKNANNLQVHHSMLRILQVCSAPYLVTPASKDKATVEEDMEDVMALPIYPSEVDQWIQTRDGPAGTLSSKMQKFVQLMTELQAQATEPLKIIVFANYTCTLKLAFSAMTNAQPDYEQRAVMAHGGIASAIKREEIYTRFRTVPTVEALYMTLKMGSVGLNLTEADTVIFLEPWYSYSALAQGEGRVHRIGQLRPVRVFYLLAKDSAEERVYQIAQRKKTEAEGVEADVTRHNLEANDIKFLFDEDMKD
jgi:SNF2 family DNA or RNA helicase